LAQSGFNQARLRKGSSQERYSMIEEKSNPQVQMVHPDTRGWNSFKVADHSSRMVGFPCTAVIGARLGISF